jgi:hypothetical protein
VKNGRDGGSFGFHLCVAGRPSAGMCSALGGFSGSIRTDDVSCLFTLPGDILAGVKALQRRSDLNSAFD